MRGVDSGSIKYWLALNWIKGLKRLHLEAFASGALSPESLFKDFKKEEKRLRQYGFAEEFLNGAAAFGGWDRIDKELDLIEEKGVSVTVYAQAAYPALLREIDDPPALLYTMGAPLDALKGKDAVAVVGTRRPSHYGLAMSEVLGRDLAAMGVAVVSGMARGCDSAAHKGALSSGGLTVAVLGTGIDIIYPRENKPLYEELSKKGILISEFPLSAAPQPHNFLRRNRIISGLSKGVAVVEAPLRSGALQTAGLALGYNREVMAVPGQATSQKCRGSNKLLKDGAALIECASDVMEALSLTPKEARAEAKEENRTAQTGREETRVLDSLGVEPLHIDAIAEKAGMSVVKASSLLLEMELKGLVAQTHGMRFSKKF